MRYTVTQFARESVGLCPFRGSYLIREDVGLCPFYNSYVKERKLSFEANFYFFSLAESPPRDLQITAYK